MLTEFGGNKPGFAYVDSELEDMFAAYSKPRHIYYVVRNNETNQILGGGGIGQLNGAASDVCELRKMYLKSQLRGLGLGSKMLTMCLDFAKNNNYSLCYLETLSQMKRAASLYEKFGFTKADKPMGDTGHWGCNHFYIKEIEK